ncbi:hypothetical protein QN386_22405 [Pseudomonas sp. CCI3.2]|uniref:hypothetical protein n=1 Tax=unclassified Pseudomonas TaxID=196821 RepID=UPI002B23DF19|nr:MULTISPECIES: hypothetical protein [unclassified Pseudomonas]MEB0078050.1 hypothetical protein [Pseudomonas sp. MH10out]MEB0104057.1 hypothetical protein [Pseudomonas sp. CCI3.2]MEB0133403.1 hypothetical protein [Pseudomonas sp. CCI2.4]
MCDCKSKNEARLIEALPDQLPDGATSINAKLTGYALMFGDGNAAYRQVMPIDITFKLATKAGVIKDKKQSMSLTANYCMFCGEKYDKAEAA